MLWILGEILCVLQKLAAAIVTLIVYMVDGIVLAIGALLVVLLAVLPAMPEAPGQPTGGVLALINYFVPLASISAMVMALGTLFLIFMLVRIGLNWVKAL